MLMNARLNNQTQSAGQSVGPRPEQLVCFKCDAPNPPDNNFCSRCGAKLLKPLGSITREFGQRAQTATELRQLGTIVNDPIAAPDTPVRPSQRSETHLHPADNTPVSDRTDEESRSFTTGSPVEDIRPPGAGGPGKVSQPSGADMPEQESRPFVANKPGQDNGSSGADNSRKAKEPFATSVSGQDIQSINPGMPLASVAATLAQAQIPGIPGLPLHPDNSEERYEADFIRKNAHYYCRKFNEMRMTGKTITWNWPAWFFGPFWCLYRKMYKIGLIVIGVQLLAVIAPVLESLISLATSLTLGMLGNYFYKSYTTEEIQKARGYSDPIRQAFFRKKGGTSVVAPLLLFVFMLLAVVAWVLFRYYLLGYVRVPAYY